MFLIPNLELAVSSSDHVACSLQDLRFLPEFLCPVTCCLSTFRKALDNEENRDGPLLVSYLGDTSVDARLSLATVVRNFLGGALQATRKNIK